MKQINIFDELFPKYVLNENKKTRLITLFSGYDSQKLAFNYLGKEVEHYKVCEFDKYAINTLNEIHNTNFKTTDIKSMCGSDLGIVEKDKYNYIMTYSFPCTDLSIAGKREGMERGSGTRSGLLWEVERLLKETKELPNVMIMENVPQVLKANGWYEWYEFLENLGYSNFVEVINAKDYGIPQNRERCFMVSILGDYSYNFPKGFELKYRLKDLLEENVDEKYYLSEKMISYISAPNQKWTGNNNGAFINKDIASTLNTREGSRRCDASNYVCDDLPDNFNLQNECLKIKEKTKKGYFETQDGDGVYINRPEQKRGVVQKGMIQTIKTSSDTLGVVVKDDNIYNLFYTIFDLCCIIDTKEKDKYERSRELLQILWEEIGKKEIWQEIRRFISVQEKKILQSNLYENGIYEDRKLQSRISSSPSNSDKYNESITNREKMFNMWQDWKTRYTPQRWELSKQQFRQFNLFMQELSYETTQGETSVQDMWKADERFRILQQTLFKIQEIWRPIENKISNGLRIRKLSPRECWHLMGVKDSDYNKITCSNAQKYKQAGNSIVTTCLMAIYSQLYKDCDYKSKIDDLLNELLKE